MYFPSEPGHLTKVNEMAEQIDEIFTELLLECRGMAKRYDEALHRIEELESDIIFLEEMKNGLV